jgi:hypothetical protein
MIHIVRVKIGKKKIDTLKAGLKSFNILLRFLKMLINEEPCTVNSGMKCEQNLISAIEIIIFA